jgi:hypothetical protein
MTTSPHFPLVPAKAGIQADGREEAHRATQTCGLGLGPGFRRDERVVV